MKIVDPEIVRESIEPLKADFEISVPQDLFYLQGHFPERPVLPGVVQIHWAIQLAKQHLNLKPLFAGMEVLKFHRIIEPLTPLRLTLEKSEETQKLQFSYLSDAGMHSQGRILFE
jgi:3-hydroxymyristoyl/3-hydroxydecanoyl-(acyl carrier protein) dehydratase